MASLKDLRRRIKTVTETQKITSAMMLVASAKLRRTQQDLEKARPYFDGFDEALAVFSSLTESEILTNPYLTPKANPQKYLLIFMTSDRGLCGGFNSGMVREIKSTFGTLTAQGKEVFLLPLGRKGREILKTPLGHRFWIPEALEDRGLLHAHEKATILAQSLEKEFLGGTFDQIICFSSKFKSVLKQSIQARQILPIQIPKLEEIEEAALRTFYEFEPKVEKILMSFILQYLVTTLYESFLESFVCEQAARMMAMDGATRNAKDLIHRLKLTYNRTRQATITKELIEIISGAEALA